MGDSGKEVAPKTMPDAAQATPKPMGGDVVLPSSGNPSNDGEKEKDVPRTAAGDDKKQHVPQKDTLAPAVASVPTVKATTNPPRSSDSPVVPPRGPIVVGLPATTPAPHPPLAADTAKPSNLPPVAAVAAAKTSNPPPPATAQTSNPPSAAPPTVTKPVFPPSKKRKLPNTTPAAAPPASSHRPVMTPHTPLADPAVVKTVHDMIGLLQTYGPLTFGQLEYNLPPIASLGDILDVMVVMGVVQVVDDNSDSVRYAMLNGVPRADVVLPQTVVEDILQAQTEVKRSKERCRILKQALLSSSTNPREVLKQVLLEYPEIVQDPIYVAALRNVHVDVGAVDRERLKQQRMREDQGTSKEATTASTALTKSESVESKMSSREYNAKEATTASTGSTKSESGESKPNTPVQNKTKTDEKPVEEEKK